MKDTRREEGVRQTGGTGRANAITEGVIWKQLLLFFFPILFGTFFQQLYNTADAVVVGRFVGKEALAAVGGSTSMLTNLLVGFFVGLSSGATVIIAQFYGAGRGQRVSEAVHTAIAFSLLCGILMTVGGLLFFRHGASPDGDAGGYHGQCKRVSAHLFCRNHGEPLI